MKEGRKLEYPQNTPDDELQTMPHTEVPKISAPTKTWTHTLALVAGVWKADVLTITPHITPNKQENKKSGLHLDITIFLETWYDDGNLPTWITLTLTEGHNRILELEIFCTHFLKGFQWNFVCCYNTVVCSTLCNWEVWWIRLTLKQENCIYVIFVVVIQSICLTLT